MNDLLRQWLMSEARVSNFPFTATTSFAQIVPYDPERYLIMLPSSALAILYYHPGDVATAYAATITPLQSNAIVYVDSLHGDLVKLPWWVSCSSGTAPGVVTCLSYDPNKRGRIRRVVEQYLSHTGAL